MWVKPTTCYPSIRSEVQGIHHDATNVRVLIDANPSYRLSMMRGKQAESSQPDSGI